MHDKFFTRQEWFGCCCQPRGKENYLFSTRANVLVWHEGKVSFLGVVALLGRLHGFSGRSGVLVCAKDLFIKNRTRTVVTLVLFWFDFL